MESLPVLFCFFWPFCPFEPYKMYNCWCKNFTKNPKPAKEIGDPQPRSDGWVLATNLCLVAGKTGENVMEIWKIDQSHGEVSHYWGS